MKTIELKLHSFDELKQEAKEKAIEKVRETYYEHNDFAHWAIDDCSLFEPKHVELENLFGDEYKFPLIKNTRENIYFSTDRNRFIDCADAMVVTNDVHFYEWLGIPQEVYEAEDFSYSIQTPRYRGADTTIIFDGFISDYGDVIDNAIEKFESHVFDILMRIENDIDYRFTDEAIIEDIISNEYEFLEDGTIY